MHIEYFLLILSIEAVQYNKVIFSNLLPFIELEVGTPGQLQKFMLDTGSFRMVVPCINYKDQETSTPPYRIQDSTTSKEVGCGGNIITTKCESCNRKKQCVFNQTFADSLSIAGYYFFDRVKVGDVTVQNLAIGCANQIENNLRFGYIATIGLMPQDDAYFPNIIDSLATNQNRSFSICFNQDDSYLSIGHQSNSNSIPYYTGGQITLYFIKILGIINEQYVFNQTYLRQTFCFLDSGTNGVYIGNQQFYNEMQSHFDHYVNRTIEVVKDFENKSCVQDISADHNAFYKNFPIYTFKLQNNIDFIWEPKNYLHESYDGYYCFRLYYIPGLQGITLGTPWMLGHEFTFDQTNQIISFQKDCSWERVQGQLSLNQSIAKPVEIIEEEIEQDTHDQANESEQNYETFYIISAILLMFALQIILIMIYYRLKRIKLLAQQQQLVASQDIQQ